MRQATEALLYNLAHELRQPLSTIESIAYYLELALPNTDPRIQEQLTRLRHLVEQSGWILNDTLSLAQSSATRPQLVDLDEILSEFVLDQMQHDSHRPHFELQLSGAPAWMDYQQGRDLVHSICRLFRTLAKPGSDIVISTRVLTCGKVSMRARAEGIAGDEDSLPAGTNLTIEGIEKLAAQNGVALFIRLSDPSWLELSVEVPVAPLSVSTVDEFDGALPSLEAAGRREPVAPGIL